MKGARALRGLAVTALLYYALALPQASITVTQSPIVWVTVDAAGSARTITPSVITTNGQLATISDAPSELRSTATYTLSPSGRASTYTGLAPVASATGTGDSPAGVFSACDSNVSVGPVQPFCLPRAGSELHPGKTYYITWSPAYFSPPTLNLTLQVLITNPTPDSPSSPSDSGGGAPDSFGLTSPPIPASAGFYALHIPPDFLHARGNPPLLNLAFHLLYTNPNPDPNTTTTITTPQTTRRGPTVFLTPFNNNNNDNDDDKPDPTRTYPDIVPILLPIVGAVAIGSSLALCFLSWRRHGRVRRVLGPVVGGWGPLVRGGDGSGPGSGSGGGGVGSGGRVMGGGSVPWGGDDNKSETDVGIQLTDRASWSPTTGRGAAGGGRNVFREEIERQERLR